MDVTVLVNHTGLGADTYKSSYCIEHVDEKECRDTGDDLSSDSCLGPVKSVHQNVHFAPRVGSAWKPLATKLAESSSSPPMLRLMFSQPLMLRRFTQS